MIRNFQSQNAGTTLTETTLAAGLLSIVVGAMVVLLDLGMTEIRTNAQAAHAEFRAYEVQKNATRNLELATYRRYENDTTNGEVWFEYGHIDRAATEAENSLIWEHSDPDDPDASKISHYIRFTPITEQKDIDKYGGGERILEEDEVKVGSRTVKRDFNLDGDLEDEFEIGFLERATGKEAASDSEMDAFDWDRIGTMPVLRTKEDNGNTTSNSEDMVKITSENTVISLRFIFYNYETGQQVNIVRSFQSRNS